tara:strand:+ start:1066 stop:1341 length:276 start_codon:yes stop_codon:yes gene_type:complete
MAGPIKHKYKKNAMVKFGKSKGRELFYQSEMMHYMNTFVGVSGRISQQASTTVIQLTSLLRIHPDFRYHPARRETQTGKWQYIGQLEEEEE